MTSGELREIYMSYYRVFTGCENYGRRPIPCWDGGTDRFGRNYKNVWEKLLTFIQQNNLIYNADQYIHSQFWARSGKKPPTPNQLLSDAAKAIYEEYKKTFSHQIRRQYELEKSIVQCEFNSLSGVLHWDADRCFRRILKDNSLALSSFFRYCKAKSLGFEDIAALFFERARSEYGLCKRFYDAVYSDIVPDDLKDNKICN